MKEYATGGFVKGPPVVGDCGCCGLTIPADYNPTLSAQLAAKIASMNPAPSGPLEIKIGPIDQGVLRQTFARTNADAVRNQGGTERGLIG